MSSNSKIPRGGRAALVPEKATACGGRPKRGSKRNGTVPHFKARQPAAHGAVEAALKFYAPTGDQGAEVQS